MIKTSVFDEVLATSNKRLRELSLAMLNRANKVKQDPRATLFSDVDTQTLFYLQNVPYMVHDLIEMDMDRATTTLYGLSKDDEAVNELLDYMLNEDYQNDYLADTVADVREDNWYFNFVEQLTVVK